MKEKMLLKYKQGLRGWDDVKQKDLIELKLMSNHSRRGWIDVANFAMMLHFIDEMEKPIELKENDNENK
jgi:hypothetical protein